MANGSLPSSAQPITIHNTPVAHMGINSSGSPCASWPSYILSMVVLPCLLPFLFGLLSSLYRFPRPFSFNHFSFGSPGP